MLQSCTSAAGGRARRADGRAAAHQEKRSLHNLDGFATHEHHSASDGARTVPATEGVLDTKSAAHEPLVSLSLLEPMARPAMLHSLEGFTIHEHRCASDSAGTVPAAERMQLAAESCSSASVGLSLLCADLLADWRACQQGCCCSGQVAPPISTAAHHPVLGQGHRQRGCCLPKVQLRSL